MLFACKGKNDKFHQLIEKCGIFNILTLLNEGKKMLFWLLTGKFVDLIFIIVILYQFYNFYFFPSIVLSLLEIIYFKVLTSLIVEVLQKLASVFLVCFACLLANARVPPIENFSICRAAPSLLRRILLELKCSGRASKT